MKNTDVTSQIVSALETAWTEIRKTYSDVPPAVIVLASGSKGGKLVKWGHYAEGRWHKKSGVDGEISPTSEVLISGEGLERGGKDVFGTLLHEAVHGVAHARKIKDTARGGRYHNKKFKTLAEELGLEVEKSKTYGMAHTSITTAAEQKWHKTISMLEKSIRDNFRVLEQPNGGSKSRMLKAECGCGTVIRLSQTAYDKAPIVCSGCDSEFEITG
jgi:hypothetical protein